MDRPSLKGWRKAVYGPDQVYGASAARSRVKNGLYQGHLCWSDTVWHLRHLVLKKPSAYHALNVYWIKHQQTSKWSLGPGTRENAFPLKVPLFCRVSCWEACSFPSTSSQFPNWVDHPSTNGMHGLQLLKDHRTGGTFPIVRRSDLATSRHRGLRGSGVVPLWLRRLWCGFSIAFRDGS